MPNHVLEKPKPLSKLSKNHAALKRLLDDLVVQYKTPDYIPQDPISQPYRFVDNPVTCEMVAFLTALLSYGRRDLIIGTVQNVLNRMENDPRGFIAQFNAKRDAALFEDFMYRFNKGPDLVFLCERLRWVYQEFETLENLFVESAQPDASLKLKIASFLNALSGLNLSEDKLPSYGLKFLFAHPAKGGPCKRINMFLRWVVRQDEGEPVDLGLWKTALSPAELIIPLDTHVTQMNRHFQFTKRQSNSWETAEEITAVLSRFCPHDPIRYDYALMGYSLSGAHRNKPV